MPASQGIRAQSDNLNLSDPEPKYPNNSIWNDKKGLSSN